MADLAYSMDVSTCPCLSGDRCLLSYMNKIYIQKTDPTAVHRPWGKIAVTNTGLTIAVNLNSNNKKIPLNSTI